MKANADAIFWLDLKASRPYMTKQQYRTIKGQMKSGNMAAARTGINRIKKRVEGQAYGHTCN